MKTGLSSHFCKGGGGDRELPVYIEKGKQHSSCKQNWRRIMIPLIQYIFITNFKG